MIKINRIKELRASKNISQADLAKLIPVSQNAISSWETGRTEPNYAAVKKLSEFFGVSVAFLLGMEDKEPEKKEKPTDNGELYSLDISGLTPENRWRMEDYLRLLLASQGK